MVYWSNPGSDGKRSRHESKYYHQDNLRELCVKFYRDHPIQLSGDGCDVKADESLFRHKQKYHRDRQPDRELLVFGLADRGFNPSRVDCFWFLTGLQILNCLFF